MKIDTQVSSLELSRRLKELGVLQFGTLFAWAETCIGTHPITHNNVWDYRVTSNNFQADIEFIAAYTTGELGEMLPVMTISYCGTHKAGGKWCCEYDESKKVYEDTEADARAAMLIFLIENDLISKTNAAVFGGA